MPTDDKTGFDNDYDLGMTVGEFMHDIMMYAIQNRAHFRRWFNNLHDSTYPMDLIMHRLGMMHTIADSNLVREERQARDALREAVLGPRNVQTLDLTDDTGQYL